MSCTELCRFDVSGCVPPGMVLVPGGVFEMGSYEGDSNERPVRQVQVDAFWIDEMEVTVAEYALCPMCAAPATDAGFVGECNWMVEGREEHPVNCVSWYDADAYCAWAGDGTKRLPTEAEWEKAARGTDARTYPWGFEPGPSCNRVVMSDDAAGGDGCGFDSTRPVGSKPLGTSPYGAHDMAGNVEEWVSDWYDDYDELDTDNPQGPARGLNKVVRGSWWSFGVVDGYPDPFRTSSRRFYPFTDPNTGFRCARTPSP